MAIKKISVVAFPTRTLGGGVATLVESFSTRLIEDGLEVRKIAVLQNPKYDDCLDWVTICDKNYQHTRKIWHVNKIVKNLSYLLKPNLKRKFREKIGESDLVIATDPYIIPFLKREDNNIFQVHTSLQSFSFYKIMVVIFLTIFKKKITKITFLDEKDGIILKKYCSKIENVKNFSPINKKKVEIENKNHKLIYFGLLQKFKDIPSIMQFASDNQIYIDFFGPLIDYSEDELRKYESEYVSLHIGRYDLKEKIEEFSRYRALIMNSEIEGEPVAILEALSLGLCVITPRKLENLTNYLNNETIFFDDTDNIRKIIDDDEYFEKIQNEQSKILDSRNVIEYLKAHKINLEEL